MPPVTDLTDFLLKLDPLKAVNRKTYINGGERVENSAEHSWHLAMACWAFAELLNDDYDVEQLIKMALVHDLGEMEAGDTFLYSPNREDAHVKERECVQTLAAHPGNPIPNLNEIWEAQETGQSPETRLLKMIDRLLPFLHNVATEGRAWRENSVKRSQVQAAHRFVKDVNEDVYAWFCMQVAQAVENGWLIDE